MSSLTPLPLRHHVIIRHLLAYSPSFPSGDDVIYERPLNISTEGSPQIKLNTIHSYQGIEGKWQEWGQWSYCDPSCSCGKKFRVRACTAPLLGGNYCVGDPTETAPCSAASCCSSTVSRIRTLESPYQPSTCQNTTSPGQFEYFVCFDDCLRKHKCQFD